MLQMPLVQFLDVSYRIKLSMVLKTISIVAEKSVVNNSSVVFGCFEVWVRKANKDFFKLVLANIVGEMFLTVDSADRNILSQIL